MNNSTKKHCWSIILVTSLEDTKNYMEFNVKSKNILGATMKATKTLKSLNEKDSENNWHIKKIFWISNHNSIAEVL